MSMQFGDFKLSIIRESTFKLDGGAMFGVVPKTLWHKLSPADDLNRVTLACNLLLIETKDKKILVETGMGERWNEKERDRYALQTLVDYKNVLAGCALTNDDIDIVILSHLHFDHAGGCTKLVNSKLVPTYPNATYYAQKGEWEFAHNANARARASYREDDYKPLADNKMLKLMEGDTEIVPGIWARLTGGHTSHHQIVTFESQEHTGVFFADIMPTKSHLTPPWVMGYDHFPLSSCDIKSKYLSAAEKQKWLVVFDHEPDIAWGYVQKDGAGKFVFMPR